MQERNGGHDEGPRLTLAARLGTVPQPFEEVAEQRGVFPLRPGDGPTASSPEARLSTEDADDVSALEGPALATRLEQGIADAESQLQRLAGDIELVQIELRAALEAAIAETQRAARSRRPRLVLRRPSPALSRGRTLLVGACLVALAVAAVSWKAGVLWTEGQQNLVLDSGFDGASSPWTPAGLHSQISRTQDLGRGGSQALEVRTTGAGDGEGAGYFDSDSIRPGQAYTFSVFARSDGSAAVYPEIRWRAAGGSLLRAARGPVARLDRSWRRLTVSGVAPAGTAAALLVVGETAGTPGPVTYVLDDAQLEPGLTAGPYVPSGDQATGRPSHPSDVAALLMLVVALLLAFASLRSAVLVALPLSLAIPPSFASLDSRLPDMTPTRALVIGCFLAALAGRRLRLPARWIVALAAVYTAVVFAALVSDHSIASMRFAVSLTIGAFAPALLVLSVVRERRDIWVLAVSLAATAVIVSGVALVEWQLGRHLIPLYPGVIFDALERGGHLRARATFPHPIVLGTFLALALPPTLGLMLRGPRVWRIAAGTAAVVIAAGLAVTLSRAPWFGAVVGVAVLAVLSGVWRRWRIAVAIAVALAALLASPIGAPMRNAAFGLVQPQTQQERFVLQVRLDLARQIGGHGIHDLVGSSLDPAKLPAFPTVIEGRQVDLSSSIDNTYVRALAQTGLLGLVALLGLLIALVAETTSGVLRASDDLRPLASGLAAALLVVAVVGVTVGTVSFSQVGTAFWLLAGAGLAIRGIESRTRDAD